MDAHEQWNAAMNDAVIQSIWWGANFYHRHNCDQLHWLALADRCDELGLDDTARLWREEYRRRRRVYSG